MSLRCLLGRHTPMLNSIVKRTDRYTAFCNDCGAPIERTDESRWASQEPLISRRKPAA